MSNKATKENKLIRLFIYNFKVFKKNKYFGCIGMYKISNTWDWWEKI